MFSGKVAFLLVASMAIIVLFECQVSESAALSVKPVIPPGNATSPNEKRVVRSLTEDESFHLRVKRAPRGGGGGKGGKGGSGIGSALGQGAASGVAGVGASLLGSALLNGQQGQGR